MIELDLGIGLLRALAVVIGVLLLVCAVTATIAGRHDERTGRK